MYVHTYKASTTYALCPRYVNLKLKDGAFTWVLHVLSTSPREAFTFSLPTSQWSRQRASSRTRLLQRKTVKVTSSPVSHLAPG